jgi:hypothetical protein
MRKSETVTHEMLLHQNGAVCSYSDWSIDQAVFNPEDCRREFIRHLHFVIDHYPMDAIVVPPKQVTHG